MFRLKNFWTLLFPLALLACSTVGPVQPSLVKTVVEKVQPQTDLLQQCEPPVTTRTRTVKNMAENTEAWRSAYERCAARMCRTVQWFIPLTSCESDVNAKPPAETHAG